MTSPLGEDGEPMLFETEEELKEALNWLSIHGYIEVTAVNEDGEFYYGTTDKGRNATLHELLDVLATEDDNPPF